MTAPAASILEFRPKKTTSPKAAATEISAASEGVYGGITEPLVPVAPVDQPASSEPVSPVAATTNEPATSVPTLVESVPLIKSYGIGPATIEVVDPACRPPGKLADQATADAGVWVRSVDKSGQSDWFKTSVPTVNRALSKIAKSTSAKQALDLLISA